VSQVGVYIKKGDSWAEVNPEVANFKTGGVLRTIGTAGIVKGDVNGHLNGLHSPNQVKSPMEFLIYTQEGVSITEYQLLRLRDQKNSREFRTVTGGVMHVSGGATRDLLPLRARKSLLEPTPLCFPASVRANTAFCRRQVRTPLHRRAA
jgi:hypothetical protein